MHRDPKPPAKRDDPRETPDPGPPSPSPTVPRPPQPPPAKRPPEKSQGPDPERVSNALRLSGRVSGHLVNVRPHGRLLELRGTVSSFREKLAAERIARRESGRGVINRLQVEHGPRIPAHRLEREVRDVLRAAPGVDERTLTVSVKGSRAILRGSAETRDQRRAAADLALSVRGVDKIVNLVRVDRTEHRLDRHAARSITARLRQNRKLGADGVQVAIAGDTAILSGTVGSRRERRLAERIARDFPLLRIDNRIRVAEAA